MPGPQEPIELKNTISNKLASRLENLEPDHVDQLIARARALQRRSNDKDTALDKWIERVMRKDERSLEQATLRLEGVIVSVTGQLAVAETEDGCVPVRVTGQSVVVGDCVTVAALDRDDYVVASVSPRRTKLSRPAVDGTGREQVIFANVDVVVIVVSVVTPPLHPRLIDRYLVAIQQGGAEAVVYVNKLDLLEDESELRVLDPYRKLGIPVVFGSTVTSLGNDELRNVLREKACAFVGHSGVGKSSIVNVLKPDAGLDTGSVSEGYGRGTHTTTSSSLHRLDDGTVLIDTPGIRGFGLRSLDGAEIASYFPEFDGFSCRFRDCAHLHEPGCGVVEAVDRGELDEARYDAYCRLKDELET